MKNIYNICIYLVYITGSKNSEKYTMNSTGLPKRGRQNTPSLRQDEYDTQLDRPPPGEATSKAKTINKKSTTTEVTTKNGLATHQH